MTGTDSTGTTVSPGATPGSVVVVGAPVVVEASVERGAVVVGSVVGAITVVLAGPVEDASDPPPGVVSPHAETSPAATTIGSNRHRLADMRKQ